MKHFSAVYQDECLYRFMAFDAPRLELAVEQLLLGKRSEEIMIGVLESDSLWEWVGDGNGLSGSGLMLADSAVSKRISVLAEPVHDDRQVQSQVVVVAPLSRRNAPLAFLPGQP